MSLFLLFFVLVFSDEIEKPVQMKPYGDHGYVFLYKGFARIIDSGRVVSEVRFEAGVLEKPVALEVYMDDFWVLDSRKSSVFLFDREGGMLRQIKTEPVRSPKSMAILEGVLFVGGQSLKGPDNGIAFLSNDGVFNVVSFDLEPFFERADELWKSFKIFKSQNGIGLGMLFYDEVLTIDRNGVILDRRDLSADVSIYPQNRNGIVLPEKYSAFAFSYSKEVGLLIATCQKNGFKCAELLIINGPSVKKVVLPKSVKDVGYNSFGREVYVLYMDGSHDFLKVNSSGEVLP